ncbi:MAG: hypothetical protein IJB97_05760, partial [Clostridia bacterium]|nr:hypothetical protein [Clostridia bacterium]
DVDTLIKNFFANYFGQYSEDMLKIFNSLRTWFQYLKDEKAWATPGDVLSSKGGKEFWPYGVLDNWLTMYDDVFVKLEEIKDDFPAQYKTYYDRVWREAFSVQYMMRDMYNTKLSKSRSNELATSVCDAIDYFKFSNLGEGKTLLGLREAWLG